MKKFIVRLIVIYVGLVSFVGVADEVELINAFSIDMSRYGQQWHEESYLVAVDNLAYEKRVFIHREKTNGNWVDIPMYYAGPAGGGKEYWRVSTGRGGFGDRFTVKMEVNGAEFWDNNDGVDYVLNDAGYLLGNDKPVVVSNYSVVDSYPTGVNKRFWANIVVDNIAPAKNVSLVYSYDNFQSSTSVAANYLGSRVVYGYGSYDNPNSNNAEAWSIAFEFPAEKSGQFYVVYEVNGETYYDNNFGKNYTLNPKANHSSMHLRFGPNWLMGPALRLIDDHLWAGNFYVRAGENRELKLDAYNDWSVNFGDNDNDGIAELYGENIVFTTELSSNYRLIFNDQTMSYSLQEFGID